MLKISVQMDWKRLTRDLDEVARKQIPFATAKALTATARAAENKVKGKFRAVFDRPTPWVEKGTFIKPALKTRLEAVMGIKDQGKRNQARYLKEHLSAGERGNKPMEKAMRAAGILPPGWLVVPSKDGVQRDAFGNVSFRTVARILAGLKEGGSVTSGKNSFRLFVIRPGQIRDNARHLAPGIWSSSRFGAHSVLKPVFLFVQHATYRKVIDLPEIVGRVADSEFSAHFARAFNEAMRPGS